VFSNLVPLMAPLPFKLPLKFILVPSPQLEFLSIEQSSVTLKSIVKSANTVLVLAPTGRVPNSQTIDPVAPKLGSK